MVQTYIGSPISRVEDERFLTGKANFVDDVKLPGILHAAVLRSPHAHAKIRSIDTSKARTIAGVVEVYTVADISSMSNPIPIRLYPLPGLERFLQSPLATDKVRHVGEAVALAVAESRYLAEDALDAIEVTYEPLTPLVDMEESLLDQVLVHEGPGTNLATQYIISIGDVKAAFESADYTRKERFKIHRHTGNPMETRGLVARYDTTNGDLTVWGPTKVTHYNRGVLSSMMDIPEEKIHFIEPDVGGGFGIRGEFYPEDFLVPFAASKLGRPVKWVEDRLEHLMASNHSRDVLCDIEVAAKQDGTILGLRAQVSGDMGAYIRTHGGLVPSSTAAILMGPYQVQAYECTVRCVMTNKMGLGTFRAPGRYESCFIRERLLDMVAQDLKIDPVELRLKNMIQPSQMPYDVGITRADGPRTVFDSGDYPMALERALDEINYQELKTQQGKQADGKYHGVGIACYVKNTGQGPYEGARVVADSSGQITVYMGITTLGQGHETSMAQICADALGVPMGNIRLLHGSTDFMPDGHGTFASRATVMGGNALYAAGQELKEKVIGIASGHLGIEAADLDLQGGNVYRKTAQGEGPLLALSDVVRLGGAPSSDDSGTQELEVTSYFSSDKLTYSYGTHAAHVAVDVETGKIDILRYVVVEDVGRAINPLLVHGQAVGGAVQGIGATILEELVYDENGQLLSGSLMDYLLPSSTDVPDVESIVLEAAPSPLNPLGVKGAGEGGIVATGGTLANAVSNALSSFGVQVVDLPLSPAKIRELVRSKPELL